MGKFEQRNHMGATPCPDIAQGAGHSTTQNPDVQHALNNPFPVRFSRPYPT
jgi:hypothetical protein